MKKKSPYDVLFYSKMCLASGYETLLTKQIKPGSSNSSIFFETCCL